MTCSCRECTCVLKKLSFKKLLFFPKKDSFSNKFYCHDLLFLSWSEVNSPFSSFQPQNPFLWEPGLDIMRNRREENLFSSFLNLQFPTRKKRNFCEKRHFLPGKETFIFFPKHIILFHKKKVGYTRKCAVFILFREANEIQCWKYSTEGPFVLVRPWLVVVVGRGGGGGGRLWWTLP